MFNVCHKCGAYRADKQVTLDGLYAVCPECGHLHAFLRLPLILVGGASGAGKSALCRALTGRIPQAVLLDADILWRPEFNAPEDNYRDFMETWLRLCKNIAQSGRPVVLFGAGVGVTGNLIHCIESRYFDRLHFAALVCDDVRLAERLRSRPDWRGSSRESFIAEQIGFNHWLKAQADAVEHPMALFDTGTAGLEQTAGQLEHWISDVLVSHQRKHHVAEADQLESPSEC